MAIVKRFEDLDIWQDARVLYKDIIKIAEFTELK